ncbi:keratin, type I cytoskeletal 10-like [Penaeus vannamei]|uniref:keratin, type I cytoskeletal 10-like n=1 Tax=Penaeus vannamei TaxID=6689 RepID=UPI00387F5610
MELLVLIFTVIAGTLAKPQGYDLSPPFGTPLLPGRCSNGQVLHVDGRCVTPRVNRRVFLYDVPKIPTPAVPPPFIPAPTVETNLLFIRTPEGGHGPDPIVVPPPQQEHVVYVLNKQSKEGQKVIEIPAPPSDPEVYFVNYADGENPNLPSGVDLQTALNAASEGGGQLIRGSGGRSFGAFFGGANTFEGSNGLGLGSRGHFDVGNGFGANNGFGNSNSFGEVVPLGSSSGVGGGSFVGVNNGFDGGSGFGIEFTNNAGLGSGFGSSSVDNGQLSTLRPLY